MFLIYCPYCEELREEPEFHAKGQAHIARPQDPEACSDEDWGDYLFFRDNPRGIHHELWVHAIGCRKFFNVTRDTVSYEILETYPMGAQPRITAESVNAGSTSREPHKGSTETAAKQQGVRA